MHDTLTDEERKERHRFFVRRWNRRKRESVEYRMEEARKKRERYRNDDEYRERVKDNARKRNKTLKK